MADPFLGATESFFNPLGDDEAGTDSDEELGLAKKGPILKRMGGRRFDDEWLGDEDILLEPYLMDVTTKPKEVIRFFFEVDFKESEVLDRLPKEFDANQPAKNRILQMVRWYVTNHLKGPDLKFFKEEKIPENFELDGKVYALSFYMLPPRRPAPIRAQPPTDRSENFAANMEAEPVATRMAITNICILFVGFALSLVGVSCESDRCARANDFGQFITAAAALSLALVASYMTFLVTSYD